MEYMQNQMDNLIESGLQQKQYLMNNLIAGNWIKFGKEYCKANNCIYLTNLYLELKEHNFKIANNETIINESLISIYNKWDNDTYSIFHLFNNDLSGFMDCEIIINMRKELTSDVLHHYLPYGLEIDILNYKCDYVGIPKSKINGYYNISIDNKDVIHYTYDGGSTGKDLSLIKPYLKPLHKLDLEWMRKNIDINIISFDLFHDKCLLLNPPKISYWRKNKFEDNSFIEFSLQDYQKLFKDKFDMFNLINSGLANEIID